MRQKIKATVFFMWPASWNTDVSSFYYSDVNLFLINYAWCKLRNIWLLLFENNSRSITIQELSTWGRTLLQLLLKIRWYVTIWKGKIKNRTFYRLFYRFELSFELCRLFLLTRTFQYISNWLKWAFTHPFISIYIE